MADTAAVVVGLIALAGGCASASDGAATTAVGAASTSIGATTTTVVAPTAVATAMTTAVPAGPAPAPSTEAPSTTAPFDPAATLQAAIAALGGSYHFATTASVDGAVAATGEGDHVGDGSRLTVTANDATVQYVITADGTWVMQSGQGWQQLDDPPATTDPVAALAAPTSVELIADAGTTVTLRVNVPSTALGVAGDGDLPVTAVVTGGVLTSVAYDSTVGGKPANVTAALGPAADASPVTAPA